MALWKLIPLCSIVLLSGCSLAQWLDPQSLAVTLNASRTFETHRQLLRDISYDGKFLHIGRNVDTYAASNLNLSEPCKSHYNFYTQSSMASWAFAMKDSSSSFPPSSLAEGALIHLGNFDECINVRGVIWNNDSVFNGQHCLASLVFKNKTTGEPLPLILKMAQCVPSTCSTMDTQIITKDSYKSYMQFLSFLGLELTVVVDELECHTADGRDFSSMDMTATAILAFFGGLVVFSTLYDIYTKNNEHRSNLAVAFSVYTNGKRLLATSATGADTLHCLHGIRTITMAWIILCHRYQISIAMPSINRNTFVNYIIPDVWHAGLTNGVLAVDTFFVLSGLLVTYVFLRQVHKTKSFNIVMYYIHRYVRLTPALAIMIMLRATLLSHSGSGPLWDSGTAKEKERCERYWWSHLLYVQTYVNPVEMCLSQTWYLAADMQMYWLSPLLLVPLWKWPLVGLALTGLLTVAGCTTVGLLYYYGEYPVNYFDMITSPKAKDFSKNIYFPVYTRYVPYVIGVALGYLLVNLKLKGKNIRLPKVAAVALWLLAATLLLVGLFTGIVFQQPDYEATAETLAAYSAFNKLVWSLGISMVIFLCSTGHGCFANTILSWDWFQPLSRLTYSAYLLHPSVMISLGSSVRTQSYLDDFTVFTQFFGDLMITLLFSVVLTLVFESPFIILEKELLGHKAAPKSKEIDKIPTNEKVTEPKALTATVEEENQSSPNILEVIVTDVSEERNDPR